MLDQIAWRPGIGDASLYGWITVAGYALGAILCWLAARKSGSRDRTLWLLAAFIMALLCVNKQLDLQSLGTDALRSVAKQQGWYEERRTYQAMFIGAMLVVAVVALGAALRIFRRAGGPLKTLMIGMVALGTFIIIRAASFEKMDAFIKSNVGGVRANHALELGGIAIVCVSALWAIMARKGKRR